MTRRLFTTSSASGVSIKALDDGRAVSELSLVLKAGSRYQPAPGVAHLLEQFAFKDTRARSALRLVRESELLGAQLSTKLTREHLILTAKFLREDLPYFVQAFSDVASGTLYYDFELAELVGPVASLQSAEAYSDAVYTALEGAYAAAFRTGLGNALLVDKTDSVTAEQVARYGLASFTKANASIAAKGVTPEDLAELVDSKFASVSAGIENTGAPSKFYSGESRVKTSGDSALVLAFPAAPSAGLTALSYALGGSSAVKWSLGQSLLSVASGKTGASISAKVDNFSDASLLSISVTGDSTAVIAEGAKEAVKALNTAAQGLSKEAITAAVAQAKFADISARESSIVYATQVPAADFAAVSADSIKKTAEQLVSGSKVLSVVGETYKLPYADELF